MVDMGGIDLAEANCTVVEGIYNRIIEAVNTCGDAIFYNWKFAGIEIAPSAVNTLEVSDSILINGIIQVTELDEVTVLGIEPPPPPIEPVSPLEVTENGVYEAEPPASGFNPVTVNVSSGDYIRYRVYDNNTTLFEEYFAVGSQVVIHQLFFAGNNFYKLDVNTIATASVNVSVYELPLAQTNYGIVQLYSVERIFVRGLDLVAVVSSGGDTAGIVFSGSVDATIVYRNYSYRQCGRCTETAILPDIQNAGTGRTFYTSPANDVETVIQYTSGQNFFASGNVYNDASELIIKNFIEGE